VKAGDKIYWLRSDRSLGSKTRIRIPAIYLGFVGKERESCFVYVMEGQEVKRRMAKLHNLLDRVDEKQIDEAAKNLALYSGPAITRSQLDALKWLDKNGGLEVGNMNMDGRSKEWPTKRTLGALVERGLIDFKQGEFTWKVEVNDMGKSVSTSAVFE
jgi:hypothetical protein